MAAEGADVLRVRNRRVLGFWGGDLTIRLLATDFLAEHEMGDGRRRDGVDGDMHLECESH
jgi:hypothetical protein